MNNHKKFVHLREFGKHCLSMPSAGTKVIDFHRSLLVVQAVDSVRVKPKFEWVRESNQVVALYVNGVRVGETIFESGRYYGVLFAKRIREESYNTDAGAYNSVETAFRKWFYAVQESGE